jgi:hypothetical protein
MMLHLGRVDMKADGVGGLSWGGVLNRRIGRDGSDFQFVRDYVQL